MLNISELMALSEASTGFYGGSSYDSMPEMSLTEATMALPIWLAQEQMNGYTSTSRQNEAMVEAVVSMNESAVYDLNEVSFEAIKDKIAKFFKKILDFLKSIINKIKTQIDKIRMTGKQLWSKYGKQVTDNITKYKDFTVEGYANMLGESKVAFAKAGDFDGAEGGEKLITAAVGDAGVVPSAAAKKFDEMNAEMVDKHFGSDDEAYDKEKTAAKIMEDHDSEIDKIIDKLSEEEKSDIEARMVQMLTGMSNLGSDWREEVRKELYGDKETLTYGSDFTAEKIGQICQNPANLEKIAAGYIKFENGVRAYEKKLNAELKEVDKRRDNKNTGAVYSHLLSKVSAYYNKYLEHLNTAYSCISQVKSIHTTYETAKAAQAKSILGKLISLSTKKVKKEDAEIDEVDMLEFED